MSDDKNSRGSRYQDPKFRTKRQCAAKLCMPQRFGHPTPTVQVKFVERTLAQMLWLEFVFGLIRAELRDGSIDQAGPTHPFLS